MTAVPVPKIDAQQLNRVVAIMTHLRSGSGLMSSLLDGHPNVLMTPDCLLMGYQQFWDKNGHLAADELTESFVEFYAVLFDARDKSKCSRTGPDVGENMNLTRLGPSRDECLLVDKEAFKCNVKEMVATDNQVDRKLFFQAIHLAYAHAQGRFPEDPIIVFGLHVDRAASIQGLVEDFPDASFLQMVRHPILSVGSHFRHHHMRKEIKPKFAISTIFRALYAGRAVPHENRPNWCAVRLEDLHQKPQETLRKICDWMHVHWDDTLLKSTVNGKQWWNEKNTIQISGPSEAIVAQRFEKYVTGFDRFRLSVVLAPKCEAWGYKVSRWHRSVLARLLVLPLLLIPFKMELISVSPFNNWDTSNNDRLISRVVEGIDALGAGRWFFLRAWIDMFKGYTQELKPL